MTILNCECGNEIFIMDETEATAWQCEQCGQWYDFFGSADGTRARNRCFNCAVLP